MPDGGSRIDLSEAIDPKFRVVGRRSPLVFERVEITAPVGKTLTEVIEMTFGGKMDPILLSHGSAKIGAHEIPSSLWHLVKPKAGTTVSFILVPQGGMGRALLGIALVVAIAFAAPYLAPLALGAVGITATTASLAAATSLITAGLTFAGMMLLNALIPISAPSLNTREASQTYSIGGGRNTSKPWGAVPVVLGRHRLAPLYAARPYTEASGNDQWLRMLFVWCYGPVRIEDLRIGNTLLSDFDDVQIETREGLVGDAPITLYPGQVLEQAFSHDLPEGDPFVVERSDVDADELSIDWSYPKGLVKFDNKGKAKVTSSVVEVEYRKVGDLPWTSLGIFDTEEKKQDPFRIGKVWSVARGQYDVRLRCTNDDSETLSQVWTALRTIRHEVPYTFAKPLAITALRIKASGQLNGMIDNLSGIVTSRCKSWNGASWVDNVETSSPADLYRYVLQHPANALPRMDAQIDLATVQDWKSYCTPRGLEFNMVRDTQASVLETVTAIATVGRANPARPNGKWSVIIDRPQIEASDHFTDRNAWDFQVERNYRQIPDAWRARFVDRAFDWGQDERIIYREGITPEAATDFEAIEFAGVTDAGKLWTEGQRRFRELIQRADIYTFSTTWESLRITRGDLILVQANVTSWGISAGRVSAVTGDVIDLDDAVEMEEGWTYAIRFRRADGSSLIRAVATVPGRGRTVNFIDEGAAPAVGDLWMFGLVNFETHRLVVKAVEPGEDHIAKITAVDEAQPFIDEADDIDVPVWTPRTPNPDETVPAVPVIIAVSSGNAQQVTADDGTIYAPVNVGVVAGQGGPVPAALFQVQHRFQGSQQGWRTEILGAHVNSVSLLGYVFGDVIEVRANAVSRDGVFSAFTSPPIVHVVQLRTTKPPNVVSFTFMRLSSKTRHFDWVLSDPEGDGPPPDLVGFRIRYKAGTSVPWASLDPMHTGTVPGSPYETSTPRSAGAYTFGIVAVNNTDNESVPFMANISLPDGVAPNKPVITTPSQVTSDTTPPVAGTADNGTTVHVYSDGVDVGSVAVVGGAWALSTSALTNAAHVITAAAFDSGGQPSDPSASITITVDTISPSAPVISNVSPVSTTDTTPNINGTGENGASLQVYRGGTTPAAAPVTVAGGAWNVDLTLLPIGVYSITAKQTDLAGNVSVASSPALSLHVIPVVPVITTATATIGNTNPAVTGTSTAGASIGIFVDGVLNVTVSADGSGNWTGTCTGLAAGARSITAKQTVSGEISNASTAITLTVVWWDPATDTGGHVDFKNNTSRLLGSTTALTAMFGTITTSAQICTNANGSLVARAANTLPLCDRGLELWEARTNRCSNRNAKPTDLTGVTLSGDAAAVLTRVDDSASMGAGSILNGLLTSTDLNGFVYKLDNSLGVADAFATVSGGVGAVGACNGSMVYRGFAGRIEIGGITVVSFAVSSPYVRTNGQGTAAATTDQFRVVAPAGATIYWILNQLESSSVYPGAPIVVNAAAATRAAPVITGTRSTDFDATTGLLGVRAVSVANVAANGMLARFDTPDVTHTHLIQCTNTTGVLGATTNVTSQAVTSKTIAMTSMRTALYGWAVNDFAFAVDGTAAVTDTSGTVPSNSTPTLKVGPTGFSGVIEQIKWHPTKPTNAVIQTKSGWTTLT